MARPKNDGRGRIGGRAAGTTNKVKTNKDFVLSLLKKNKARFELDLEAMTPYERARILAFLLSVRRFTEAEELN